eukprot:TRINITY_DN4135_c0_g1::TRINITY_DN4135_c0_g1_i1::g.2053::m.2053 TRINITY_DN4135_c0_g1::TRINITY_DN4135_c0_g1_i1::g.2053  ORF type:complete len:186 (+),score=16.89,sp/Q7XC27/CNBL1_ORYSJ/34.38/3e-25,EF-hand_1/PF00036.27/1.7e+02,EF-hand_1/PF00036.27/1.2e-05,EF-hand_1/PF00036.27/1.4e-05,EF-hand_1/PF00036.27/4.5e-05,EF-hand_7/PF13499.1/2.5,EF-hand_7/PF13499.1/0.0033,EF-hand_7/PF13499.1/1.9e-10,EF-hand_6/PF13405.1/3e+03,EF-hand_6/PF13405.1/2.2e+03,EF-hand_6/PF13405.1/0.0014,EF-hand_6/PF13405.1/0.00025,EF-
MGQRQGKQLLKEDFQNFLIMTHFTADEIKAMHQHFMSLVAKKTSEKLNYSDFCRALGLRPCLLTERIFALFDSNNDRAIDFDEFISGMSIFKSRVLSEEKLKFTFCVYDVDGDGSISKSDLKMMLQDALVQEDVNITEDVMQDLLNSTFTEADLNQDGNIDFNEYKEFVKRNPSMINDFAALSEI